MQNFEAVGDGFGGDSVEDLLVPLDGPDDRGVFQLRNSPLALIVESGSAEVAEEPKDEPSGCCCSITTPSPSALASVTSRNSLDPEIIAASRAGKPKPLGLDKLLIFLGRCAIDAVRTRTWLLYVAGS